MIEVEEFNTIKSNLIGKAKMLKKKGYSKEGQVFINELIDTIKKIKIKKEEVYI